MSEQQDSGSASSHDAPSQCGYVAIVGRPNVGKSTLLNHMLGQKLCITSRKPQTTRHAILGVKTEGNAQLIFVDTPGQHLEQPRAINRYMNRVARSAMNDVDVIVFVIDRLKWNQEDEAVLERVLEQVNRSQVPVIVVLNKIDRLSDETLLLPHVQMLAKRLPGVEFVPVSALRGDRLDTLEALLVKHLPQADFLFPDDQITDRSVRFLVAEIIREKIIRQLGEEVPYAATVEIEQFKTTGSPSRPVTHIDALILVEREGQKKILIGEEGTRLKSIGQDARIATEQLIDSKVMLNLWIKVKNGWSDDERAMQSLGYLDL